MSGIPVKPLSIDLATELGEAFAVPPAGLPLEFLATLTLPGTDRRLHPRHRQTRADESLIGIISSAHLACGFHSGDPLLMRAFARRLANVGVEIGAHPSYPDIFHFGQARVEMGEDDLAAVISYQIGGLGTVLKELGLRLEHIKCHGALYFDTGEEEWACSALVRAAKSYDPELILVLPAGTPSVDWARSKGMRVVEEGYADRRYQADGRLVPRTQPNAVITDPAEAAAQIISMARDGTVRAADGSFISLSARTFCLHSDTPDAARAAGTIARVLHDEGMGISPIRDHLV